MVGLLGSAVRFEGILAQELRCHESWMRHCAQSDYEWSCRCGEKKARAHAVSSVVSFSVESV